MNSGPSSAKLRGATFIMLPALAVIAATWFALAALATPFDHDESQYIAGAYFSAHMLIFRDFLYLQPPLHAWTFAPLVWLFPSHMVVAMRLATGGAAAAAVLLLWASQRVAGISRGSALIATLAITGTAAFQFTGSVVRNDMLPTLLVATGMLALLQALRRERQIWFLFAGACFGLAIASKLNFIPIGVAAGLFLLLKMRHDRIGSALRFATGGLAGATPMILAWAISPEAFIYGVVSFAATGPFQWYAANGAAHELSILEKLGDLLKYLWRGPALVGLLLLAGQAWMERRRERSQEKALALWLIAGGLIGAALPTPSQVQYVMPLLPPLALGMGLLLDDVGRWRHGARAAVAALLGISALFGSLPAIRHVRTMVRNGSPMLAASADARWAGAQVRSLTGDDKVASLSPQYLADSGLAIDRRFAAGPFVYRTGWTLDESQARRLHVMTPALLADMDREPPAAILAGYEMGIRKLPLRPDDSLIAYARARGYRMIIMPDGVGRLYVRSMPPAD